MEGLTVQTQHQDAPRLGKPHSDDPYRGEVGSWHPAWRPEKEEHFPPIEHLMSDLPQNESNEAEASSPERERSENQAEEHDAAAPFDSAPDAQPDAALQSTPPLLATSSIDSPHKGLRAGSEKGRAGEVQGNSNDSRPGFSSEADDDGLPPIVAGGEEALSSSTSRQPAAKGDRQVAHEETNFTKYLEEEGIGQPIAVNRMPSFPEVPPLEPAVSTTGSHLHSQVEDIINDIESDRKQIDNNVPSIRQMPHTSALDPFEDLSMGHTDDFFSHVNGLSDDPSTLETEEANLEESQPLVHAEQDGFDTTTIPTEPSLDHGFDIAEEPDNHFYAQISGKNFNAADALQDLDKRSNNSSQELDTSNSYTHYASGNISPMEETRPSLEDLTGGGIAVSTSTVISQVAAQGLVEPLNSSGEDASARNDPTEEELAAKWQAALGDDDFLDESSVDPSGFFEDDGEGFLDDELDTTNSTTFSPPTLQPVTDSNGQFQGFNNISTHQLSPAQRGASQNRYTPSQASVNANAPQQRSIPYAPNGQNPISDQFSASRPGSSQQGNTQISPSDPAASADSKSPYELPFDVTRPKKRPERLQDFAPAAPQPPPRTSSISKAVGSPGTSTSQKPPSSQTLSATPNSFFEELPVTVKRPSIIQRSFTQAPISPAAPTPPAQLRPMASTSSFFEELAPAPKSRPANALGRASSHAPTLLSPPPPQPPLQQSHQITTPQSSLSASRTSSLPPEPQLLLPQKMPLFESIPTSSLPPQPSAASQSRYSPAPPGSSTHSPSRNRYAASTAPPRPSSVSAGMPFQPRTSSPLARSASTSHEEPMSLKEDHFSRSQEGPPLPRPSIRSTQTSQYPPSPMVNSIFSPDFKDQPLRTPYPAVESERPKPPRAYHHPLEQSYAPTPEFRASGVSTLNPPPRSRTSSPNSSAQLAKPPPLDYSTISRSASFSDLNAFGKHTPSANYVHQGQISQPHPSVDAPANDLIVPTDGRELDPLQRWRGAPIFTFGLGGHTVSSFPKQVPMFTSGSIKPLKKCLAGEVKIGTHKGLELDERILSFPGPLRSKNKKKEVLEWLSKAIEHLSQQSMAVDLSQIPADYQSRQSEKILLWKVLRVMVENDGALEGSVPAMKSVQALLLNQDGSQDVSQSLHQVPYGSSTLQRSIFRSATPRESRHTEDRGALENLRKLLLQGEREKAVWLAVDQHLWGHAMLICSTLSNEIWKQIIQEFIRQEVRAYNENAESLAALYDVFAGNWEESVDQLVPPSARAGYQMVSKTAGSGPAKNALEGLNRWQETLALTLGNRTGDDQKAIAALGRLLMTYGRVEAAHVCFLFARSQISFSGVDETQMGIVLLGADHTHQQIDVGKDTDAVLLTEVYEFAATVQAPSPLLTALPHLQSFKLQHAVLLSEAGHGDKAMSYCDAIQSIMKSTTKLSPYYHKYFFSQLNDFNDRLRQVPKESNASWIARPSMEGVSGSVWNKFTKFVQGDDSDAASTGSGKGLDADTKPFAGVTDTPVISRDPSPNSSYGSYPNGSVLGSGYGAPSRSNSKYAPVSIHTPLSVPDQSQANQLRLDVRPSSHDPSRPLSLRKQPSYASMPNTSPDFSRKSHNEAYQPTMSNAGSIYSSATLPRSGSSFSSPSRGGYSPYAPNISPLPPSQLHQAFHPDNTANLDEQVLSPPTPQYTSTIFDQPPEPQRSFSEVSQLSPTTVPPVPSHYVTSPEPAKASLVDRGPGSEMYDHLNDSSSVPAPTFGYEPPALSSFGVESSSHDSGVVSSYEPDMSSHNSGTTSYNPETSSYDPGLASYEPPADTYQVNGEDSPIETKPKRSFMDDDDDSDLAAKATALKAQEKARKDREADEAFRKAAEADGEFAPVPNTVVSNVH